MLHVEERRFALLLWVKLIQHNKFAEAFKVIQRQEVYHPLRKLAPVIHEEKIVVGGRLNELLPIKQYILPADSTLTTLIIRDCHLNNQHAGPQWVHSALRDKFWILKGLRTVRSVIGQCGWCRRYKANPFTPIMATLPYQRVKPNECWVHCGVDFVGPIHYKKVSLDDESFEVCKVWITLWTCAVSRAVHLEFVDSMSMVAFIMALRRFMARRGCPSVTYCDNAKQFRRTPKELRRFVDNSGRIHAKMNIKFRHIHTNSPWEGGFYERQVGSVKAPLKIALGKQLWTFLEIQTILCDIEAMINNRPLTMVGSDPEDMTAITPSLLMTGRPMGNLWCERSPSEDIADSPTKLWARRQEVADVYWKRFQKEYLLELQSRSKWTNEAMIDLDVGDVVLLADQPKKQRSEWPLAIVTELRRGAQ